MSLLWTVDDFERWRKHPDREVRWWACERLKEVFREVFSEKVDSMMAAFLGDPDPVVAKSAARHFLEHPSSRWADALLETFKKNNGHLASLCARALAGIPDDRFVPELLERIRTEEEIFLDHPDFGLALAELRRPEGADLARKALESLNDSRNPEEEKRLSTAARILISGSTYPEIVFLFRFFLNATKLHRKGYLLLAPVALRAAVPCDQESLERLTKTSPGSSFYETASLASLSLQGEKELALTLRHQLEKKAFTEVVRLIGKQASGIARQGEKLADTQPAVNLKILQAMDEVFPLIEKAERAVQRKMGVIALLAFARLLECRELLFSLLDTLSEEAKLGLFLSHRDDIPEDRFLIDSLSRSSNSTSIAAACLKILAEKPLPLSARRACRLLGRLKAIPAVPKFLELLFQNREGDLDFLEDLQKALVGIGEPVVSFVAPFVQGKNPGEFSEGMIVLMDLPYASSVDLVVSQFSRLREADRSLFVDVVESLANPRFIPLLKASLQEDEPEEDVYLLLCDLYGHQDPDLPAIRKRVEEKDRLLHEKLDLLKKGSRRALLSETLYLPLICQACQKTYHYRVDDIFLDTHADSDSDLFIRDDIHCKGCGAENRYELTPEARVRIMHSVEMVQELAEAGEGDIQEGPVKIGTFMARGKRMSPQKALQEYEREVAEHPGEPSLRVGYGNVLMTFKRKGEARIQFEKALELDPLAAEALHTLAQMEEELGNPQKAYALYRQFLEILPQAHFYRATEEVRENLKEHAEVMVWELGKAQGIPVPSAAASSPLIRSAKVGRNEPCPCGSGKKYKKCCLEKEPSSPPPPQSVTTPLEARLLRRLAEYVERPRYREAREVAWTFYTGSGPSEIEGLEEAATQQFLDWFIHDYRLSSGKTLIEEFAEAWAHDFSRKEREMILEWSRSHISLYEVLAVHPERAEVFFRDLITGKELVIQDASASRSLVKWDLVATRVVSVEETLRPSIAFSCFSHASRDSLLHYFTDQWNTYREESGQSSWESFMKARGGHLVEQFAREQQEKELQAFFTSEHQEFLFCKAFFDVRNFHGALFRLKQEYDFPPDEEKGGDEPEVRFAWLKRGKSKALHSEGQGVGSGMVLEASVLSTPVSNPVPSLGTVTLTKRRLVLETFSRERLEAGKRRLSELLGDYVEHRTDTFESPEEALRKPDQAQETGPRVPPEVERIATERFLSRHYEAWADTPLPALDGKTPKEMLQVPGGENRVRELLRIFENSAERQKREGKPFLDVRILYERLGLPVL